MDRKELKKEKQKLSKTISKIDEAKADLEVKLETVGKENLDKLRELRESPETDGMDFFMFLEQIHQKNLAFNLKDRFQRLEELEYLAEDPYFARIDLKNKESQDIRQVYIGKFGYTEEEPLVTDWRAKIASVYYRYRYPQKNVKYSTPDGEVVTDLTLKRTYEIDEGELIRYYNNDLQLDETEIITEKIEQRTGGVLEDIVETIQESQLDIIEEDPRKFCIVQGCVGSGKSTVAIHKLSHIFFNYPHIIRPQNSLLVAKSHILISYLSTLFPKLGIFNLNYKTLKELLINMIFREEIKEKYDLQQENYSHFSEKDVVKMSKLVEKIHEQTKKRIEGVFEREEFEPFRSYKYTKNVTPYENINEVISDLDEELIMQKEQLKENPKSIRAMLHKENIKTLKKIITRLKKLRLDLKNKEIKKLLKTFGIEKKETLNYHDTLAYLYFYLEIIGLQKYKKFEYCVVDEGQDFSLLEMMVLKNIVLYNRFCVFGDLNQGYLQEGLEDWRKVDEVILQGKETKFFTLDTNYRSTKPIISLANKIMESYSQNYLPQSIDRAGKDPKVTSFSNHKEMVGTLNENLEKDVKDLDKSIGIICFNNETFKAVGKAVNKLEISENKKIEIRENKRINYVPKGIYYTMFDDCKGLEFSKVYVLDLDLENIEDESSAKKAFISVTRAMNELLVYCVK